MTDLSQLPQGKEIAYNSKGRRIKVKRLTNQRYLNMFELVYPTEKGEVRYEIVTRKPLPEVIMQAETPDSVHILPYSYKDGVLLLHLIKEFRYAINDYIYAIPAGLVEGGESTFDAAKREVEEEIGCRVLSIERSETSSYSSVGMTDERGEMFEAEVELIGSQHLDENERIEVVTKTLDEVEALLEGENFGARSKLALRCFILKQKIKTLEEKLKGG